MGDGPGRAVDESGRAAERASKGGGQRLVPKANAEQRGGLGARRGVARPSRSRQDLSDQFLAAAGAHWLPRARSDHDATGLPGENLGRRAFAGSKHLDLGPEPLKLLGEVEGERIAVVEEEDQWRRTALARGELFRGSGVRGWVSLSCHEMNIVIVGAGEVGQHLADILSREEHAVTVVDPDPSKSRKMTESLDVQVIVGDGTRADTLMNAGASTADLIIAVSDEDRVNMLTSVVSKKLGAGRVIIRLKDTQVLTDYRYFYKDALGFDVVISTEELAAESILSTVRERHALEVESFANGKVQLRRLPLREASELTSAPLGELRIPPGVLVTAVQRERELIVPSGEDELRVGDQVYVLGSSADLDAFERTAGETVVWKRTAVIMGAGSIGREIARRLAGSPGIEVFVVEKDRARATALDSECSGAVTVLVGDATDFTLLQEERIAGASVFVATTNDDEINLIACMLAKGHGAERTVALIQKASYREVYDFLEGIDLAISPRMICAQRILRFVRAGSPRAIAVIGQGLAEVLELETGIKEPTKVKKLGLPKGVVIGAIVHGESVAIATGDSVVRPGDTLIVFTITEKLEEAERLLRPQG